MHKQSDFPHVPIEIRVFNYNSRSNNTMAIKPIQCRTSQFLNSFFPRLELLPNGTHYQRVWLLKTNRLHLNIELKDYMFCFRTLRLFMYYPNRQKFHACVIDNNTRASSNYKFVARGNKNGVA